MGVRIKKTTGGGESPPPQPQIGLKNIFPYFVPNTLPLPVDHSILHIPLHTLPYVLETDWRSFKAYTEKIFSKARPVTMTTDK